MNDKISAIIITLNEEKNIAGSLASLSFVDEIVVVDSGSSDRTEEICRSFPAVRFFHHPWQGYGPQKTAALALTSHEWVFSLDADEIVTPELAQEILDATRSDTPYAGYRLRRKNMYRGQWIRHSGWWPDDILRLFRKETGRFNDRVVHESVEVAGPVGFLKGVIEHHSFNAPEDFLVKAQRYSVLGAAQMKRQKKKGGALRAVVRGLSAFIKSYIIKRGFLDGRAGLLIAVSNAVGVFYRIMKLTELHEER